MKPIRQEPQGGSTVTSIDDLPMEDESTSIKNHQSRMAAPVRPQARLRRDRGNYEEDDNPFGEPTEMMSRRPPGGAVKDKIQATKANDHSDVMAKSAAFAKMREQDNSNMRPAGERLQNRP
jgi:hypothetical protein